MRTKDSKHSTHSNKTRPSADGPVMTALGDAFTWAFAMAERDTADWPEARRRVRNARRALLRPSRDRWREFPTEDVLFTARLLARIFEAELHLPFGQIVRLLDRLGLPTEVVPRPVRVAPPAYPESVVVRLPYVDPDATAREPAPIDVERDLVALFRRRATPAPAPASVEPTPLRLAA